MLGPASTSVCVCVRPGIIFNSLTNCFSVSYHLNVLVLTISQKSDKRRNVANSVGVKDRQMTLFFSVPMEWKCVQNKKAPRITKVYNELCKCSGETSHY
jgi:hypothetical protein